MSDAQLNADDLDQLGKAILSLTEELWVMKDRQRVLESLLAEAGFIGKNAVDAHQPDDTLARQLSEDRQQLLDNVVGALRTAAD
jgi:hypothetical protein